MDGIVQANSTATKPEININFFCSDLHEMEMNRKVNTVSLVRLLTT